jgi:hypothetical protein
MEKCGAARPTGAHHAGSDGLKRSVGAAMHADTKPGARPRTLLAAAMLIPSSWTRPLIQAGRPGLNHGERADAGGSTYTDTKTGHAQGQDGSDGDEDDDDNVFPVPSLRHGLHHVAPV